MTNKQQDLIKELYAGFPFTDKMTITFSKNTAIVEIGHTTTTVQCGYLEFDIRNITELFDTVRKQKDAVKKQQALIEANAKHKAFRTKFDSVLTDDEKTKLNNALVETAELVLGVKLERAPE